MTKTPDNTVACDSAFFPRALTPIVWAILAFGVVLRLAQYAFNRSLWLDEVWLALNIVNRPFLQLFERLDYHQAAPPGFLTIEKLAVDTLGNNEYVLRLFPLACGLAALFLFFAFTRRHFSAGTFLFALCLFAISRHLVNYSSQLKQYSCDLVSAVAILWMTFSFQAHDRTWKRTLLFGLLGAVTVWFSHTACMVLAAAGGVMGLSALFRKDWGQVKRLSVAIAMWLASFAPCYLISLRDLSANAGLIGEWGQGFMPFPPKSMYDLQWYPKILFEALENPVGLTIPILGFLMLLVGGVSLYKKDRERFFILLLPVVFLLIASSLRRFPALGRFLLFVTPALMLFIGEGIAETWRVSRKSLPILGLALVVMIFARPVAAAAYHVYRPHTIQELRSAMPFLEEHYQPGDLLLVHSSTRDCLEYYAPKYGLENAPSITSPRFNEEIDAFFDAQASTFRQYKRVWFVFAAINDDVAVRRLYLDHLDKFGTRVQSFERYGSSVDLYEIAPLATP